MTKKVLNCLLPRWRKKGGGDPLKRGKYSQQTQKRNKNLYLYCMLPVEQFSGSNALAEKTIGQEWLGKLQSLE